MMEGQSTALNWCFIYLCFAKPLCQYRVNITLFRCGHVHMRGDKYDGKEKRASQLTDSASQTACLLRRVNSAFQCCVL